jgi:hypothetical protein
MWRAGGENSNVYNNLIGGQKERDHLEDQGIGGRMGSEWILGRMAGGVQSASSWLRIGMVVGLLSIRR